MKNAILGIAVVAAFAGVSQAALVVSEPFSYNDGNLVGQDPAVGGPWAAHSGAGATPVQVVGGSAVLVQGAGSREDVNVAFEGAVVAGPGAVLTASFDLTVPSVTAAITDVAFAHFLQGTSNFTARVWVTAPSASGYRLALSNDSSITDGDGEVRSGDLAFDTLYHITTTYTYDTGFGTLSVNGGTPLAATDPGFSNAIAAYALRQAAGNTSQVIDNLNVSMVVPEPASLSLLAGLSTLALRRRSAR